MIALYCVKPDKLQQRSFSFFLLQLFLTAFGAAFTCSIMSKRSQEYMEEYSNTIDIHSPPTKRRRIMDDSEMSLPQYPPVLYDKLFEEQMINALTDVLTNIDPETAEIKIAAIIYAYYIVIDEALIDPRDKIIDAQIITPDYLIFAEGYANKISKFEDLRAEVCIHLILECKCKRYGRCDCYGLQAMNYFSEYCFYLQLLTGYYNHGYDMMMQCLEHRFKEQDHIEFYAQAGDWLGNKCGICEQYRCVCPWFIEEYTFWD